MLLYTINSNICVYLTSVVNSKTSQNNNLFRNGDMCSVLACEAEGEWPHPFLSISAMGLRRECHTQI